jgi:hypothetical protein
MLTKVTIAALTYVGAAKVTHGVPTNTGEFVAAGGFDEGDIAHRTGAFNRFRHSTLNSSP